MSSITQCPACSTMFRVVPDQLRISDGWVRCGQCDEVFDANAQMQTLEELRTAPAPTSQQPDALPDPEPEPGYDWGALVPQQHPSPAPDAPLAAPALSIEVPEEPVVPQQEEPVWPPEEEPLHAQQAEPVDLRHDAVDLPPQVPAAAAADALEEGVPEGQVLEDSVPVQAEERAPSFMAPLASAAPRRSRLGTALLLGLCALLALLLAGQVLWLQRDRLAATAPDLRPLLQTACDGLGCSLSPPREIEAIAIDSSAFTSVRPGVYLLKVSLKNTALLELATPALELTLTDADDQPLLRRVLQAGELGSGLAIAAGAELAASLPIAVEVGATPQKIAGYKLLAFYP